MGFTIGVKEVQLKLRVTLVCPWTFTEEKLSKTLQIDFEAVNIINTVCVDGGQYIDYLKKRLQENH